MSRSKDYQRLLNSRRWWDVKRMVWQRAGGLCEECLKQGIVTPGVDCHHIRPVESAHSPQEMEHLCFNTDNIRLLCREHGLARPVYVGDTAMDERAAAEAGCPFIHVTYGFGAAKAPAAAADCAGALLALLKGENHV